MTKGASKTADKAKKKEAGAITFRCQSCGQDKPIEEMRTIRRFFPMLVVCRECEKTIR
jgi:translation initiation factor 2 beta subunit (eIF-2beta)/eIF-5